MKLKVLASSLSIAMGFSGGSALAAPALQHIDGLLVLPNVRVVQGKLNGNPSTKLIVKSADNMRIFAGADEVGVLAEPTQSEITSLATAREKMQAGDQSKSIASPGFVVSADGQIIGSRIADLSDDADFMPYSVVRKEANGALRYMCVQGKHNANKFVFGNAAGARNDR
jgi:hypothetical protein